MLQALAVGIRMMRSKRNNFEYLDTAELCSKHYIWITLLLKALDGWFSCCGAFDGEAKYLNARFLLLGSVDSKVTALSHRRGVICAMQESERLPKPRLMAPAA
jgi:hypothetical protein